MTDTISSLPSLELVPKTDQPMGAKDFKSDQEVRWCPGCGDYAILAAVQGFLPELGLKRENIVFVSGIGCSSRFPYYMNTYGMHSIHGRAPAMATGLKRVLPDHVIFTYQGDGDLAAHRPLPGGHGRSWSADPVGGPGRADRR